MNAHDTSSLFKSGANIWFSRRELLNLEKLENLKSFVYFFMPG